MTEKKPRKKAPKSVGPKTLKKVTSKAVKGIHPFKVQFGTRHELGEVRTYPTGPKAKQAIVKELNGLKPWLLRHNNEGLEAVNDALAETDNLTFHKAHGRLECQFDKHYDMWLVAEFWTTEP